MDIYPSLKKSIVRKIDSINGYNSEEFISTQLLVPHNGVMIPASMVHIRSLPDGPQPLVLYGYGSYETCEDPHFSIGRLSLLKRGVIFVIAHVRGGGECGKNWYNMGKLNLKQNTFSDFIAVATYLIQQGWTTSQQMVARGGSAGGLLMGAVMNQAPRLFKAVVAEVPFVDVLTTMLDENLPLSISEREEWGNPEEKQVYDYIKAYSPYDNIQKQVYPHLLATSGWNDSRVGFWEPTKWVLKLRDANPSNFVLLYTEMGGHTGPTGTTDQYKSEARILTFILSEIR